MRMVALGYAARALFRAASVQWRMLEASYHVEDCENRTENRDDRGNVAHGYFTRLSEVGRTGIGFATLRVWPTIPRRARFFLLMPRPYCKRHAIARARAGSVWALSCAPMSVTVTQNAVPLAYDWTAPRGFCFTRAQLAGRRRSC